MKIIILIIAVLFPTAAFSCEVFSNNGDIAIYTGHFLTTKRGKISVIAAGTGLPFRTAIPTDGSPPIRIEWVEVFDYNEGERGDVVGAILLNDILYRPDCQ